MKTLKIAALCVTFGCAINAHAETVTLKIAHFLPANSNAHANVIEPWCAQLSEESQGRIKCQLYPSMQLGGTPATLADMARNGVADIVWTAPGYSAGKFPRVEALELPFLLPYGGMAGNEIIWNYYEQYAQDDFKDYKVLALFGDGGMDVHTRNSPIKTLADFKGLKLRASGRTIARTIESLGATPVSMPPAQMTEAISKGVVDGAVATWEVVAPTKLDEVTKFHSAGDEGQPAFGYTVLSMLMNKRKYDRMPDDLKAILDRNSGKALSLRFGKAWDVESAKARESSAQGSIVAITASDYQAMQQAVAAVPEQWAEDATSKGLDGKALLDGVRSLSSVKQ
ncbi:MAG: TRAP transporter substrate-binding protein [Pseudomonas sp.]|uniref:TRAP transporter substrate-binding protein n=1 Tax=Pseudomonas sp. TaxID=306 RepID=UPI003981CEA0